MAQQTMTRAQAQAQAKGEVTYKTLRYIEHREEMLAYQKRYHEENHDAFLQYQKEYYQRTKEAKKERYNMLVHCDCCKKDVRRGAIANHRKTKKHMRNEEAHNEAACGKAEPNNEAACGKAEPNEAACGKAEPSQTKQPVAKPSQTKQPVAKPSQTKQPVAKRSTEMRKSTEKPSCTRPTPNAHCKSMTRTRKSCMRR